MKLNDTVDYVILMGANFFVLDKNYVLFLPPQEVGGIMESLSVSLSICL